jgi:hypothetical protein
MNAIDQLAMTAIQSSWTQHPCQANVLTTLKQPSSRIGKTCGDVMNDMDNAQPRERSKA